MVSAAIHEAPASNWTGVASAALDPVAPAATNTSAAMIATDIGLSTLMPRFLLPTLGRLPRHGRFPVPEAPRPRKPACRPLARRGDAGVRCQRVAAHVVADTRSSTGYWCWSQAC